MFGLFKKVFGQVWEGAQRSARWAIVREHHLVENPECEACGTSHQLEVHHITPVSVDPSKELDFDNLITLCVRCHLVFGHLGCFQCHNPEVQADSQTYRARVKQFRGQHHASN